MSQAPNFRVIAKCAGIMILSTHIRVCWVQESQFEVNSRRAFDILLSYHLGSDPPDQPADRLTIKLALPTRFRWFKDEFIHSNRPKAVYKEESLRNPFEGFSIEGR
jgi:hypothetical protein